MNENVPSVTVLIAARPGQAEIKAVAASRALDYPADKLEIIVARGKQPSAQRNAALKAARGDLIYFLDDDSAPEPGKPAARGGPFQRPEGADGRGAEPLPARGAPAGTGLCAGAGELAGVWAEPRPLCGGGQGARDEREGTHPLQPAGPPPGACSSLGGFNEALYPNEENALMDELQKRGGKLIYDPQLLVHRRPRSSLKSFARMLMTYGRGRAEQFRLHPTPGSALNFVPPLFCLYLLALPFLLLLTSAGEALSRAAGVLCAGRAGPGRGPRGRRASLAKPGGYPPDCADAYPLWLGLLAGTLHDA